MSAAAAAAPCENCGAPVFFLWAHGTQPSYLVSVDTGHGVSATEFGKSAKESEVYTPFSPARPGESPRHVLWYVYRSMRVVYGQGRVLTFAKLLPLSLFYLVSGALMLAVTTVYSALTL
jgi:hypothetical protein